LIKEISDLRDENQKQSKELKLKSLVLEKYETELFKYKHESFLQPEFQGKQQFSEALINLLKKGRTHSGKEILKLLNIDPKDSEAVRIVHRQLQILQDFKLIKEDITGWRWIE
jgi:oligoendopeptidase F